MDDGVVARARSVMGVRPEPGPAPSIMGGGALAGLVRAVLGTVHQEYPHKLDQELNSDDDLLPPRRLNPAFYGCYDWHSAVHSHWFLVRSLRHDLPGELRDQVIQALDEHLDQEPLDQEVKFFAGSGGRMSERPYGWAWLLLLHAECVQAQHRQARSWAGALEGLASLLRQRLLDYASKLAPYPLRSGTHGNTALALQLTLEASRLARDPRTEGQVVDLSRKLFSAGQPGLWAIGPGGSDFLSPALTESSLMAEVMAPSEFNGWIDAVIPATVADPWQAPLVAADDANLSGAHLEGLLVTRAWSMAVVSRSLDSDHPQAERLARGLDEHLRRIREIEPLAGFHRAHWLPSFLLYLEEQLSGGVAPPDGSAVQR